MNDATPWTIDPDRDLVIEREIPVSVSRLWSAWTEPHHLRHWFAPAPLEITQCEVDLRPGGAFRWGMRPPAGPETLTVACFLEVRPLERLVWTDALLPGFRPSGTSFSTAAVQLQPVDGGTRYAAIAIHGDEAARRQHEEIGFASGGTRVLEQLVRYALTID